MKKLLFLLLFVSTLSILVSCVQDQKPGEVKISKDLSLTVDAEYTFSYTSNFVLRTEFTRVYDINKNLVKTIARVDTLPPSLTNVRDTLVYTKNEEDRDTIIYHLKEYQTYIKVSKTN